MSETAGPDSVGKSPERTYVEIDAVADAITEAAALSARFALGKLQREVEGDSDRTAAVRVEGSTVLMFGTRGDLERLQPHTQSLLSPNDLPYLRERAKTDNLPMRARYLHAIALLTKRMDDGRTAADAYLDAIANFRAQPSEANAEAFHGLIRLFPLAAAMSKSYGASERYKETAIGFILDPGRIFRWRKRRF